ncbi:ABC transporter substrate-binding protein [Paenibacillus soyae]|uniref:ABC transporter substrate-binding protein n=1 Tax=Paenibacillus soyae TaxID=2969249 RepID=A0A9X2MTQ3_9BACL|nr:ABC transporter substrate-binding protein [Paenibacillus soyae]MCR2806305.1 ABC transporter substrate-binding protein [Paenibacillus soyae]
MKKFGNWLALPLAASLVFLSACSDGNNQNATEGSKASEEGEASDALSPITITMFSSQPNTQWEDMESPVGQKIKELTGVTLKPDFPVGDPMQKLSLMAASAEYPDLIFANNNVNTIINAGGLIDLRPLIEEHGPNIKKLYGDYLNRLKWSKDDPAIYFLGTYGVNEVQWEPRDGFMLQHEVVKELGYPELKTVKDFENAIRAYMEKYPTIDGQPTLGLSLLADDWRIAQSVTNPAVFATGGSDDGEWYIDDESKDPVIHYTRPEEKEYFQWLNHMFNSGLIDPDSFVQKYDQYKAKIASGRVLGLIDSEWQFREPEQALLQAGKPERTYGMYPIVLNETFKNRNFQSPGYSGGTGVGISVSAEDPVRIIKFLDWLCSEEAQILNNWGIEGEHYTIEDGKRVISPEEMQKRLTDPQYGKKTGIGTYLYPFPEYGVGVQDSSGQTYKIDSKEQIVGKYTDIEKEVLKNYGATMWMDLYPKVDEFPVKPWGAAWQINIPQDSDGAITMQKLNEVVRKRIPEMIMAKPDAFDGLWDSFQAELTAIGVPELEEQFQGLLNERIEMFSE